MRKLLLTALGAAILFGAAPALAQLYGTWAGEGDGYCYPRPGVVIYPWQTWKGVIPDPTSTDKMTFKGEWFDEKGNHGTFLGTPVPSIPEVAVFHGKWYWFDPDSPTARPRYGGDFEMIFHFMTDYWCEGTWTTIWPTPYKMGTMKGEKVD